MREDSPAIAWLYPGQGSQEVGMGAKLLKKCERAIEVVKLAEEYCGLDLLETMRRGPDKKLAMTEYAQPALVAISCAYTDLLRNSGHAPTIVAGHSLGELSALYAANVLEIHDVLRLAAVRGQLMGKDAIGGMLAVASCEVGLLENLIAEISDGIACIANLNAPNQTIVSGDDAGLASLLDRLNQIGARAVRLNVGGAWHSPLVAVAALEFEKELRLTTFSDPSCDVAISSTAGISRSGEEIKTCLMRQMTKSVLWHDTVREIYNQGCRNFYEVGCGKVLKGLLRRIFDASVDYSVHGIENGQLIDSLLESAITASSNEQEAA